MHRLLRMNCTRIQHLPKDLQAGKSDVSLVFLSSDCVYFRFLFLAYICLLSAEFLNHAYQALPGFLASTKYKSSPTNPADTAVQMAFDSKGKDLIGILMERPDSARGFGTLMSTWGEGHSLIQDLYPINERLPKGFDDSRGSVMFVDVGGGYGQKAIALKRACPQLPGRFIVQDLPGTVANAPKVEGIEMMEHDFFTEQPIKGTSSLSTDALLQLKTYTGARAYYIRQCLHNWPTEKCLTILKHIRDAMKPGYSKLFVHELIVAERGASIWSTTQDFNMMTLCATMERTEGQWREMLGQANLKVVGVYPSKDGDSEGIIEAEKA
jgi:hypothetical protein